MLLLMTETRYLTDLNDKEWIVVEPTLPELKSGGRPRIHSIREILNAIFYLWRIDGTWERIHTILRGKLCNKLGHDTQQ
jgi:transposase